MLELLNTQTLATFGARVAVLGVGGYALAVRFRTRGKAVDCRVPTWSAVTDLLPGEVTLVAPGEGPELRWLYLKGPATALKDPDWEGLGPPHPHNRDDLYQILRIEPRRIELVDERRGWGYRETADL